MKNRADDRKTWEIKSPMQSPGYFQCRAFIHSLELHTPVHFQGSRGISSSVWCDGSVSPDLYLTPFCLIIYGSADDEER